MVAATAEVSYMCNDRYHASNCAVYVVERNTRNQYFICFGYPNRQAQAYRRSTDRTAYVPVCPLKRSAFDNKHSGDDSTVSHARLIIE